MPFKKCALCSIFKGKYFCIFESKFTICFAKGIHFKYWRNLQMPNSLKGEVQQFLHNSNDRKSPLIILQAQMNLGQISQSHSIHFIKFKV